MALTSTDVQADAAEQACGLLTAFCVSIADDAIEDEAGQEFFVLLEGLSSGLSSTDPAELAYAKQLFATTMIKIAGIVDALLNDCADCHEVEKFDLLAGIVSTVYGSL